MTTDTWFHGTEVTFNVWKIPEKFQDHKNGMPSHSAIFFTTDRHWATQASNGKHLLCTAQLDAGAKVLDMTKPHADLSENYRAAVVKMPLGRNNPQVIYPAYWTNGWKTGNIMKYATSSEAENREMQSKALLARTQKHTPEGASAFNELQRLTRSVIEELVVSARDIGFDAVIGNEIDTLTAQGRMAYKIMFALNPACLSHPVWL